MQSMKSSITLLSDIHNDKVAADSQITIAGWVRTRRDSKKFSFLELNDGSTAKSIQIIVDATLPNYTTEVSKLTTGAAARVEGKLVLSPGKGQKYEMQAVSVQLVGEANPETYPLQKKEMTFEYLREVAHLRTRTATFSSVFRIRSRVSMAIHQFFQNQGFYYVHTPILTTSDGEGAGETFKVTTLPLDNPPRLKNGAVDFEQDFFKQPTMLCVTGQLEGELYALSLGKIYTFGPTFRAENSNTPRHLAEFWMIEPEMAFWNLADTMQLGQDMILHVLRDVFENCADDLEVLSTRADHDSRAYLRMTLDNPNFVRVSYTEAIDILKKSGRQFEFPVEWGCDLKTEHERFLCETHFKAPTFVYDYPADLKAFYMYVNDDGKTVRATDLLVPGIGEVIGGSQREDRESVLFERMKTKGIDPQHMEWYLATRRFGGAPHSGFGLGLERLVMWITGMANIRDVIPFPRTPGNCTF